MKIRKFSAVLLQTDETFVIRRGVARTQPACKHEQATAMVSPDDAAARLHLPIRLVYRLLEMGCLHFEEIPAGSVTICMESLGHAVANLRGKPGFTSNDKTKSEEI